MQLVPRRITPAAPAPRTGRATPAASARPEHVGWKTLLVGGVAVTAAATATSVTPKVEGHAPQPAAAPALVAPAPARSVPAPAPVMRSAAPAAAVSDPAAVSAPPAADAPVSRAAPSSSAPAAASPAPAHDPVAAAPAEPPPAAAPDAAEPAAPPAAWEPPATPAPVEQPRREAALPVQSPKPADAAGDAKAKKHGDNGRRGNGKGGDEQVVPVVEIPPAAVIATVLEPLDVAASAPEAGLDPAPAADADAADAERDKDQASRSKK